eukprot:806999-Pyramimonas_sp.AAC.1
MARASRIEGGSFSNCGSPVNAAHIRLHIFKSVTGSHHQCTRNCVWTDSGLCVCNGYSGSLC